MPADRAEFELPAACRDNTPEAHRARSPGARAGAVAEFPFVTTDFTSTAQRLIPGLRRLAAASPMRLDALLARGLASGAASPQLRECLARMGLERRATFMEHVYAALLRGALDDSALQASHEAR